MPNTDDLMKFLKSQRLLAIAAKDELPWIANVFYGIDDNFNIYFISSQETKHSQQILKNPTIAFSTGWYNPKNHQDRKAVQGTGSCRIAKTNAEIKKGVELHNLYFPEFAEDITFEWTQDPKNLYKVWVIEPTFIKFWSDELYGEDETETFNFTP